MKNYESLAEALDDLRKRGYEADFETQSPCLYCSDLDLRLIEEEFNIDEVYEFEADADPDSNTVVYAISSSAGIKGTIVDELGHLQAISVLKWQGSCKSSKTGG